MSETLVFTGGTLVSPLTASSADLVVRDGLIEAIRPSGPLQPGERAVDCRGLYIGPGLIDIHVHGGCGHDFVTGDPAEISLGVEYHLAQGTTGIVPSALSVPFSDLRRSIAATREAARVHREILGYHVEGIYLDQTFRGGHLTDYVHDPNPREYRPLIEAEGDFIREWTLAPELPGALDLIATCRDAGIVPSAGHSQARYEEVTRAIDAGLRHATHLMCAMGNLRLDPLPGIGVDGYTPGLCETVLLHDEISTEVISDGYHLHPALIRLAYKCKGADRLCLVSDAMLGVGMPEGILYKVGGQDCLITGGLAILPDRKVIASSATPLSGMLRFAHLRCGIPLTDAWAMASRTPARIIGVEAHRGTLTPGKDADLLLLDENLRVAQVYSRGRKVADGAVGRLI